MGRAGWVVVCALTVAGCAAAPTAPEPAPAAAVTASAVADTRRPEADRQRDGVRKPAEIIAFAGVKPGDKVAELAPGGGYYTRLLAATVGPSGKVYAVVSPAAAARPGGLDAINAVAAAYPNVTVTSADLAAFTVPEPVDLVWTSENYHDFHNGPTANVAGLNRAAFAALKPGGVFYVEDHAAPGTGVAATSTLHRIDPSAARTEVEAAGFRLEAQSDLLANPEDPHTAHPRELQGRSDKFAFRFRRPR